MDNKESTIFCLPYKNVQTVHVRQKAIAYYLVVQINVAAYVLRASTSVPLDH